MQRVLSRCALRPTQRVRCLTTKKPSAARPLQSGVAAIEALENASLTKRQAAALVNVLSALIEETHERQRDLVASSADVQTVRAELNERVFNSTLKFDVAQRHLRELLERDIKNLRAELRTEERKDHTDLIEKMTELERSVLRKETADDKRIESIITDQAHLETRILRYMFGGMLGGITAVATIGLAMARLLM